MADDFEPTGELTEAESAELEGFEKAMGDTHAWHQPDNKRNRDRVQQLYQKQDSGPTGETDYRGIVTADPDAKVAELIKSPDYWKNPRLQEQVRQLIRGQEGRQEGQQSGLPEPLREAGWTEGLWQGLVDRSQQITDAIGGEIDGPFLAMPEGAQAAGLQIMAAPQSLRKILDGMDPESFEALDYFWVTAPDHEKAEIKRVLGWK